MTSEKDLAKVAIEKTIEESFKAGKELLATIGGPASTQLGGILGDQFAYWRFVNMLRHVDNAAKKLKARGVDPKKVLPPTLVPLLEAASLQEDPTLSEKWASMLANAADPTGQEVSPRYPEMLKGLTALEVAILDWLSQRPPIEDPFLLATMANMQWIRMAQQQEVERQFELVPGTFAVIASHLHAVGICEAGHNYVVTRAGGSRTSSRFYNSIRFTPVGEAFVNACKYDVSKTTD